VGDVIIRKLCFVQANVSPLKTLKNFVYFDSRSLLYGSLIGKGGFGTVRSVDLRRNDISKFFSIIIIIFFILNFY